MTQHGLAVFVAVFSLETKWWTRKLFDGVLPPLILHSDFLLLPFWAAVAASSKV